MLESRKVAAMDTPQPQDRFFTTTRGKIVQLLRRGPMTVVELAEALELTDNAVRAHLAALERDGIVAQGEPRRGVRKPAFTYELAPAADRLFPKAYGTLMRELLDVLGARLPEDVVRSALREVGHRVARERLPADGDIEARLALATSVLGELGGLAAVEPTGTGNAIRGSSSPLATLVEGNPDGCALAEAMLSDLVGLPVRQVCDQGPPARCRFEISLQSDPAGALAR
jgi:predicted ArsR family transcriptional regulator